MEDIKQQAIDNYAILKNFIAEGGKTVGEVFNKMHELFPEGSELMKEGLRFFSQDEEYLYWH